MIRPQTCTTIFLSSILTLTWLGIETRTFGDEGMIPISDIKGIDLKARGIELTAEELFEPGKTSVVDGICRVNGCTGSFVSSKGLIITNHHCAFDAIQKASTKDRDLLTEGFQAAGLSEEIPAPGYTVRVTEDYIDVSAKVLAATNDKMSGVERAKAIEQRRKELEIQAEKEHAGLRAEVAEMFAGKTYYLFLYTYLKDVRLVFAPPASIGNFGGEVDNWEWPRHTGDFSFMRAYTAPDGSSATYSKDNVPYKPKRVIRVNPSGVNENDAVFLLGYPGRTVRHKTASFMKYERDIRLPTIVELYQWQIGVMDAAGTQDRAIAIKHATRTKSLANVEKRSRGQLKGIGRAKIVEQKLAEENALQKFIDSDPERKLKYGDTLKKIESIYLEISKAAPLEMNLAELRSACRAASFGWFVVDAAYERAKPDMQRETPYMDRNFDQSLANLKVASSDWHQATDAIMLAGMLSRLKAVSENARVEPLENLLAGHDPIKIAEDMISATRLGQWPFIETCLQSNPEELRKLKDPLLNLLLDLYPTYIKIRDIEKDRDGQLGQLYSDLIDIKREFLANSFIPDANATLRFTSGHVKQYTPSDAIIKRPISTLQGVIEKTTGIDPFITPKPVLEKYEAGEFGNYLHPELKQVPVAILYDTDTTGGNSGSPVLNKNGELVGVNFDRCFEATINDFAWNADYSRSIGVDIRYVLWVTAIAYDAKHLLHEIMQN
ncbi:MAG: hypothetical protein RLY14_847 [Planctomycetota bacterium]|jgi:hypothetical protein